MARSGEFSQSILGETNQRHAVVFVADVSCGAPEISGAGSPGPWSLHTPIADTENDWPSRLRDCIAEFWVLHIGLEPVGVTPIDLHVVYAPAGVRLYVLRFVLV